MKALPKKFLPLILFAIAVTSLFSVQPAQAYTVTLQQVGSNVVATGSGAINLTGLSFPIPSLTLAEVNAGDGVIITGPHGFGPVDEYTGFMGPPSFGSGGPRSRPTLAAETLSEFRGAPCSRFFWCHRAMLPVLLYRTA
jgi:hypothetical protein